MRQKIKLKVNVQNAFNKIFYKYISAIQFIQIFFGGSSAGKSIFISDRAVLDVIHGGRNYLICRNVGKYIRKSVFNEIQKSITKFKLTQYFKINKSDMVITCLLNGYQFVFVGLDDVEKIKSITPAKGVFTDVWIEEATETQYESVMQIIRRMRGKSDHPKRVMLSFNPIFKTHWIFKHYFSAIGWVDDQTEYESDDLLIIKTTYKDNAFLDDREIKVLEEEKDDYFYNVYTLGNWGVLGDVVFKNWTVEDFNESTFDIYDNGLDFGFSNDPTALIRSYYHKPTKTLYICEDWEGRGETNPEIASNIKPVVGNDLVICDSAEPKSITELCDAGINAIGAEKGKDSINFGIQWLRQQTIKIKPKCQATINNFQLYQYRKNKDGEVLNQPVDKYNDFIDALRYSMEHRMKEGEFMTPIAIGKTQQSIHGDF